jgi:UDP-2,3-diacylglucosamine pyrophosphatase LpxH
MEYKLKSEESLESYKIRLCKNKDLYDLRWQDISELWFEETAEKKSPDWFRKFWRYYSEGYQAALKESPDLSDELNEITEKTIEFEKRKIQYQDQRKEFFSPLRVEARIDNLFEVVLKEIKQLHTTKPLQWFERTMYPNQSDKESLLIISDTHYGLFVRNYWNNFDNEEFKRRMKKLITKTIMHSKFHNVKTLNVFLLGDLINGLIHQVTRIINTEDAVTQTMKISEILAEIIVELCNEFEKVKLYNVRGNHDRVTPNKKDEIAKESFNDFVPWYLKARLSHVGNLEFIDNKFDDEIIVADILGHVVFGVHGHKDKITQVTHNLTMMTKVFPDYIVMGHVHHHEENEDHGVEVIVNRSFSGVDEYAKDIRKTSKAGQKLIIFCKDEGRLTTYDIKLSN